MTKMMPLLRATVTAASRMMLPAYVFAALWIGYWYTFGPTYKLQGPSLTYARETMPMHVWGALALTLGVMLTAALLSHHRLLGALALCIGAFAYFAWTWFYLRAGISVREASMVTPIWPFMVGWAHLASARSLIREEVN